ncbi:hypothetical protein NEIMUCOT_05917 [Neisseria mucosa ATCC 25996]|uniref:Uncharacterized protein n=1 Tax=Neisseria mucosa (strain ATCC 25996 / DSM 4631 / NCTC 10774 / M26) TaxID=546266 RepID=D2ZZ48_NEIM2|nr:hypothetical protein NEIMUCOT_05917 [Neisseria mucosa ATCC 25996]
MCRVFGEFEFAALIRFAVKAVFAVAQAAGVRAELAAAEPFGQALAGVLRGVVGFDDVEPCAVGATDFVAVEQSSVKINFRAQIGGCEQQAVVVGFECEHEAAPDGG